MISREEAKKHFWMDTDEFGESVAKRFGSINYQKIFTGYYMGSEIDKFIDKIYDSFEAELKAKDEEIETQRETINLLSDAMKTAEKRGIDKASEEYTNRTCESCKYYKEVPFNESCGNDGICTDGRSFVREVDLDFGCNKFKRKEDEK